MSGTVRSASDKASTASSAYADSGKYASWGKSSDGGSRREKDLTVFRRRARKSGGFLMANLFQPSDKNEAPDSSPNKPSPSRPSPSKSRQRQTLPPTGGIDGAPPMPQASLDPTQLVQMALSLSEGRRRHASASLQVPAPTSDNRRVRSTGAPVIQVSPGSPMANDFLRPTSFDSGYRASFEDENSLILDDEAVDFQFSQATLHRAERARKFFELSSEYRRLLCHLPPLKPANSPVADYTFRSQGSPRSTQSQKEPGREYNPLQVLRNRKARHREQRPLDPPVDAYDDVDKVRHYIDDLERDATDAAYRTSLDAPLLPSFRRPSRSQEDAPAQITRSHKRTDTAVSKIVRPENDWSFTPAELVADAVWLLQPENRACIENRHGHRIFPQRPRSSFESARSGRRSGDSRPSISRTNTWGSVKSDEEADRGRKRPKFLSLRHVDNTARKHLFRNRSRSSSASSISSARPSNRKKQFLGPGNDPDLDNTGPLERQMKKLIEKESLGVEADSPEFISPDKWDRSHEHSNGTHTLSPIADSPAPNTHKRNDSSKTDEAGNVEEAPRYSFDDSTAPSSPVVPNCIPSFGMSLSPPTSRQSSPERKFGLFRSSRNPSDDKINRTDFAATSQASLLNTRQVSDTADPPRSSFESLRPAGIKRHRTTNSISNALFSSNRRMSKDVGVGRFFKSGRIGDLVRSDSSRQNDQSRKKEQEMVQDLSESETDPENDQNQPRKMPPANRSRTTIVGATPKEKEKEKQRFHIPNLPSFKSSNTAAESDADQDPIARQNKLHREESRSSRFDRLAPPRINLPKEDRSSVSPTQKIPLSRYSSDDGSRSELDLLTPLRKNRISHQPGGFEASLPTIEHESPSRRPSPGKRHWSISDRAREEESETDTVTSLDIARVRALYLSSGIKAHEIVSRANSLSSPPSPFFITAASTAREGLHPVTLREEFTVAARMLHKTIKFESSTLDKSLISFRNTQVPSLHSKLDDLRHKVDEKFTPLVHATADEADAFTVALTTQHTLSIKQVNDAIDNVLRRRRRNLIFLQKASFTVLEWVVLGVMWCVWFVVVIIRFFRGLVVGTVKGVRWMLWL